MENATEVEEHNPTKKQQELFKKGYALISKKNAPLYQKAAFIIEQHCFGAQVPDGESDIPEDILSQVYDDVIATQKGVDLLNGLYPVISSIYNNVEHLRKAIISYASIMYQLNGFVNLLDQYFKDIETFNLILNAIEEPTTRTKVTGVILANDIFRVADVEAVNGKIEFKKDKGGKIEKDGVNIFEKIRDWSERGHQFLRYQKSYKVAAKEALAKLKGKFVELEEIIKDVEDHYSQGWVFILSYKDVKISDIDKSYNGEFLGFTDQLIYPDYDQTPIDQGLKERWVQAHIQSKLKTPYYPINSTIDD